MTRSTEKKSLKKNDYAGKKLEQRMDARVAFGEAKKEKRLEAIGWRDSGKLYNRSLIRK